MAVNPGFPEAVSSGAVTVMDGGMGRELIRRGVATRTGLWSAAALLDSPDVVREVHLDFIAAGARMITTNSYSCIPSYLSKVGLADRYADLAALAGRLARDAAIASGASVRVAGGLPPLSESYRPDLVPGAPDARPVYAVLASALEPRVDLFLCETMSSIAESRVACEAALAAASKRGLPVYVSWTLRDEPGAGLRSGESVSQAFSALADLDVGAFLFNCTHPDAIEAAVTEIAGLTDKPVGGYPNRFTVPAGFTLDGEVSVQERHGFGTRQFVAAAHRCIAAGASLFGGCCAIGPGDIGALTKSLSEGLHGSTVAD